jgi:hypothetical protein
MHVISCFNERVLYKIRGKACYSLWLNKPNCCLAPEVRINRPVPIQHQLP